MLGGAGFRSLPWAGEVLGGVLVTVQAAHELK